MFNVSAGAPFVGQLPCSGVGLPKQAQGLPTLEALRGSCGKHNCELYKSLKEDKHSKELFEAVMQDADLGRMTSPSTCDQLCWEKSRLAPRFAVEQLKEHGRVAIRPIDNFSWSAGVYCFCS